MHSAQLVIIRINVHRRPLSCSVGLLDVCLLEGFINNWTSRVNDQLIIIIRNIEPDVINTLLYNRPNNHLSSSLSKSNMRGPYQKPQLSIGHLVYLHSDKGKTKAHPRYIVTSIHDYGVYKEIYWTTSQGQFLQSESQWMLCYSVWFPSKGQNYNTRGHRRWLHRLSGNRPHIGAGHH